MTTTYLRKAAASIGELTNSISRSCLCAFAALLCLAAIPTTTAMADPTYGVMNASGGIYWRSAPDWNTPVQTVGFGFYPDTVIAVHCYQAGAGNVPGSADYMWEYATDVGGSGFGTGWVNEHFINDGQPINVPSPGVPPCGGGSTEAPPPASPPPGTGSGGSSSSPVNAFFNRQGAVYWALMHAKDPQPRLAMCAWFVSHALWAGGLPKVPGVWSDQGNYSRLGGGTAAEWQVPNLEKYLFTTYSSTYTNITPNLKTNAVPQAVSGDLIFYDWEKQPGEGITHVAIVVGMAPGNYPEVAEMGQFDFGLFHGIINRIDPINSGYQKRGWTWSQISHHWLQWKYPNMKAYLFHFNGGY